MPVILMTQNQGHGLEMGLNTDDTTALQTNDPHRFVSGSKRCEYKSEPDANLRVV